MGLQMAEKVALTRYGSFKWSNVNHYKTDEQQPDLELR